ncbi:hypothetical protein SLE2022_277550 [Rubroshorea leprosula]
MASQIGELIFETANHHPHHRHCHHQPSESVRDRDGVTCDRDRDLLVRACLDRSRMPKPGVIRAWKVPCQAPKRGSVPIVFVGN